MQPSGRRGRDHLGQYLFPLPVAAEESLPQFLLPACGSRTAGFCQTGLKVTHNEKVTDRMKQLRHWFECSGLLDF